MNHARQETLQRRDHILEQTVSLLAVRGIERVRLQDVAQISGASIGALQHYFGSREELIDAALDRALHETLTALRRTAEPTDDAWTDLCRLAEGYETVGDRQERTRIWASLLNSSMYSDRHRQTAQAINDEWGRLFTEVLERGAADGTFHLAHPIDVSVALLLRLIDGMSVTDAAGLHDDEGGRHDQGAVLALATYLVGRG